MSCPLKEDARSYYEWASSEFPEQEGEFGVAFHLHELEVAIKNLEDTINHKFNERQNQENPLRS